MIKLAKQLRSRLYWLEQYLTPFPLRYFDSVFHNFHFETRARVGVKTARIEVDNFGVYFKVILSSRLIPLGDIFTFKLSNFYWLTLSFIYFKLPKFSKDYEWTYKQ